MTFNTDDARARRRASLRDQARKRRQNPVFRAKEAEQARRRRQNPVVRAKQAENARRYRAKNQEEYNKKMSERHRKEKNAEKTFLAGRPRPDVCDICGSEDRIVFDHCHSKGHFRGWVCHKCNVILGFSEDDVDRLRKLIAYLERTRTGTSPQLSLPGL